MARLIEHSGVVDRVEGDTVRVKITSRSACGACSARQACGLAEAQEKIVAVRTHRAAEFAAGDEVMVGVRSNAGARAVLLAYVGAWLSCSRPSVRPSSWAEATGRPSSRLSAECRSIMRCCGASAAESNTQFILQ